MKSKLFVLGFLAFTLALVSCNKENLELEPVETAQTESDEIQMRGGGPLPDLVIPAFGSNISSTTTICGPTLPNISCMGGDRQFTATIVVSNIGAGDVAPGSFRVRWVDVTNGQVLNPDQLVNHNGIPAGTSIRVNRPIFVGPCDCPPPFMSFTHTYQAFVDINNDVVEAVEGNNRSPLFDTCDGC